MMFREFTYSLFLALALITLSTSSFAQEVCTFTQGYYGNEGGMQFGQTTTEIIQDALAQGPIVLGYGDRKLTIVVGAENCILQSLPGGGSAKKLPKGNLIMGASCDLSALPLKSDGRIKNNLITQTIALSLNIRYGSPLEDLKLESSCVAGSMPEIIDVLGWDATVKDLLYLANIGLGGGLSDNLMGALPNALGAINDFYSECNDPCGEIQVTTNIVDAYSTGTDELNLYGTRDMEGANLTWTSKVHVSIDYFEVEKSTNNINFETIEMTESVFQAHLSTRSYSIVDKNLVETVNYYRVKQYFRDGSFKYSNTFEIGRISKNKMNWVSPNPANDFIQLKLPDYAGMQGTVQILNSWGDKVFEKAFDSLPDHSIHIDLDNYPRGIYFTTLIVEDRKRITTRFMVENTK